MEPRQTFVQGAPLRRFCRKFSRCLSIYTDSSVFFLGLECQASLTAVGEDQEVVMSTRTLLQNRALCRKSEGGIPEVRIPNLVGQNQIGVTAQNTARQSRNRG